MLNIMIEIICDDCGFARDIDTDQHWKNVLEREGWTCKGINHHICPDCSNKNED